MRKLLALAFAFMLSVVAIGSPPEPDRQIPDQIVTVAQAEITQAYEADFVITNNTETFATTILTTDQEAVNTDKDLTISLQGKQVDPITLIVGIGELVIEESPKPRDRYLLPIWEFSPDIEPPSNRS